MGRKALSCLLTIALVLSLFAAMPMTAGAVTTSIYVDTILGNDINLGLTSTEPVKTIEKALSLVTGSSNQYRIILAAGEYASPGRNFNLPAGASVEIVNEGALGAVVVYKDPAKPVSELFYISEDTFSSLTFTNLTLTGDNPATTGTTETAGTGIYVYSCERPAGNEIHINGCEIENLDTGIDELYSEYIKIYVVDSQITAANPISMDYGFSLDVEDSQLIMTSGLYWYSAINLNTSSSNPIAVNIKNNIIDGVTGVGRGIYEDAYSGEISGNTFKNLDTALELNDISNLRVNNNTVETTKSGFDLETYFTTADIQVIGNTLISKGSKNNNETGIKLYVDSNTTTGTFVVAGNKIVNFAFGLYYDGNDTDPVMNLSLYGDDAGGNTFRGNTLNLYLDDLRTVAKISAASSDWGTTDRQEVLSRIYVDGVYLSSDPSAPEVTVPADALMLDDTITTSAIGTAYVDDDYSLGNAGAHTFGVDAFRTIQEALPYVVSGGTVEVADGHYRAPIWLDRPISLIGTGEDVILDPIPSDSDYDSDMILVTGEDVTIDGLYLNSGHNGISFESYSLYSYYASRPKTFSVFNCEFYNQSRNTIISRNFDYSVIPGEINIDGNTLTRDADVEAGGGVAIYIESTAEHLNLMNNSIDGLYTAGAYLYSTKDIHVENNEFSLTRDYSNVALHVAADGNVQIQDNLIELPLSYDPTWTHTGINLSVAYNSPPAVPVSKQMLRNTVTGFNFGIVLSGDETAAELFDIIIGGSKADANDLRGNQTGLRSLLFNFGGEPTNATYNSWGKTADELLAYIQDTPDNASFGPVNYSPAVCSVTYDGNSSTGGSVPADNGIYQEDDSVTVLGNTGSLVKTDKSFVGWTTQADGGGTFYRPGATFSMETGNVILYAKWVSHTTTNTTSTSTSTIPDATVGESYTYTLGVGKTVDTIPGLLYNSTTGVLGGTPTSAGSFHVTDEVTTTSQDQEITVGDLVIGINTVINTNTNAVSITINNPIVNEAPVITSNWSYTTLYFGHTYPFTLTVTDHENTAGTKLYGYMDSGSPSLMHTFTGVPGAKDFAYAPVAGEVSAGAHTAHYYAQDVDGAVSNLLSYNFSVSEETSGGGGGGASYSPPPVMITTQVSGSSAVNKTRISSTATSGTAAVGISSSIINALLDKANETGGTGKEDVIEVAVDTPDHIQSLKVSIAQSDLEKIASRTDSNFAITSPFVSMTFDSKALDTISKAGTGGTVTFSSGIVDNNQLSQADKEKVKGRPVYDFTVMNGDQRVSYFKGGHATVTIGYTLEPGENPDAVVIYYLADNGSLKTVRGHYDAEKKAVVFETTHFSKFVIGYNPTAFIDVAPNAWYQKAIDFIAARGITTGTGDNKFSPDAKLTRGQFIVLLMNAYDISPASPLEFDVVPFSDAGNTYYTDYLLMAKGLGIVNGIGSNLFAPEKEITRQEMFVMLYNAFKVIDEVPAPAAELKLLDFHDANQVASWAQEALTVLLRGGIISGSNGLIDPASTTTRAQMAQVLYNLLSK